MKVALVTGAGSGIGRAVAVELSAVGFLVVLAGRRSAPLTETVESGIVGESLCLPTDVTDERAVDALFSGVRDRFGRLDLLFNNAGTFGKQAAIQDVEIEDWKQIVDINLTGAFLVAQGAFRMMAEQRPMGGRIINNGSISGQVPRPASVGYSATKHAINGLTKSLSLEGRAFDIAVGQIDVGNAATELSAGIAKDALQADGSTAGEPMMDVADVGRAVLYMASLPVGANVASMTVMATKMPLVGRG